MERDYEWPRYWFDRDGPRPPIEGYLTQSDELTWLITREQAQQLSELTEEPCLVLLGDPGLGKSYSLREAARALETNVDGQREIVQRLDLRGYDNSSLRSRLFESESWRDWLEGKTLHLFLDSFDETLSRDTSFHRLLIDELEAAAAAISRLRLRIVCRSAEWIPELGRDLRRLFAPAYPSWTEPLPRQMILAQLRRRDVALAAECEGLDPDAFLGEIAGLGLQGMAAVPLTLEMLLDAARESGRLPETRAELFEDAVLRLVGTHDREQSYSEARATLSAGERLAVGQRLAAAAIFSGKTEISTHSPRSAAGELRPAEISGRSEQDPRAGRGASFVVEERHILEVLRTALFVDIGPDRVRFRHRSLAEYLAASYLIRHQLDRAQLASLLIAPGEEEERLIPQLREVAAWMAALDSVALEQLLGWEPEMVLGADRLKLTSEQTDLVVAAMLTPEVAESFVLGSPRLLRNLRAIDHPGLASVLRGPLGDRGAPESVRQMAVSIARACERRDLEQELLGVAFDAKAAPALRAHAAVALGEVGSDEARRELIPLAKDSTPGDKFRQVQGAALSVAFPSFLDLEETLAILTEPVEPAPKSNYVIFLRQVLPGHIAPDGLPTALRWAEQVQPQLTEPDEFNRLVNKILRLAWPRLQEPQIADLTVRVIHKRLEYGVKLFGPLHANSFEPHFDEDEEAFFEHTDSRRILVRGLVGRIAEKSGERPEVLIIDNLFRDLVRDEDRDWVLERHAEEAGGPGEFEWKWLANFFAPAPEEFLAMQEKKRAEYAANSAAAVEGFDEEIERALERIERGDLDSWPRLIEAMRPGLQGDHAWEEVVPRVETNEDEDILTRLPGWKRAESQTRERIVGAAAAFLEGAAPDMVNESLEGAAPQTENESLEGTDPEAEDGPTFGTKAIAGCRALLLLAGQPVRLSELSDGAWERWAPVVFDFPLRPLNTEEDELIEQLFATAARAVPAELARWVSQTADRTLAEGGDLAYALGAARDMRDPRLAAALLPKLEDATLPPRAHSQVLGWVIDREPDRAVKLVEPYMTPEVMAASLEGRARAFAIAEVLSRRLPVVGWPLTKRLLDEDRELGSEVLSAAASAHDFDAADLPPTQLVELVATVFELFPPAKRGDLDDMRGRLSSTLAERGTDESVALVEELHRSYPETVPASFIPYAKEKRRASWNALDPRHILELCHANTARLVFDDRGLQEAVRASLRRIQTSLREGDTPLSQQLWNSETGKPEYEDWISNWLAERLKLDLKVGGKVMNREVQVAPSISGKGRAKTVDIKVTAPTGPVTEEAGNATVFIEVKGAWNPELESAMKDQLIEDYLLRSGHRYGIYLVLWFPADDWDRTDSRSRWDGGMSFEEAEDFFSKQAEELSESEGVSVRAFVLNCSR